MSEAAKKRALYDDLCRIPEGTRGEIINGELIVTPRPSRRHTLTTTLLGTRVTSSYHYGEGGGPGGWIIIIEPEIGLGEDILVPDLAGWKQERFPVSEPHNWISAPPDWVCEVLSPGTVGKDKIRKMLVYARHEIPFAWVIDPLEKTLEVYRLELKRWVVSGLHGEKDKVRAEPFMELEIDLNDLWLV